MKKHLSIIGLSLLLVGCTTARSNDAYEARLNRMEVDLNSYESELNVYESNVVAEEKRTEPVTTYGGDVIIGGGITVLIWYLLSGLG